MPRCVVPGCRGNGHHKFPADEKTRRHWVKAVNHDTNCRDFKTNNRSRLCFEHHKELIHRLISQIEHSKDQNNLEEVTHLCATQNNLLCSTMPPNFTKLEEHTCIEKLQKGSEIKAFEIPDVPNEVQIGLDTVSQSTQSNKQEHEHKSRDKLSKTNMVKFYAVIKNVGKFKIELSPLYLPCMASFMSQTVSNEFEES